jgi:hypothetical protein
MKSIYVLLAVCFALIILCANPVPAQTKQATVEFWVDDKKSEQPFKVFLSVEGGAVFEPKISNNSFVLPLELQNAKYIQLRFVSGKNDLNYDSVHISKFDGEMIFGVDNPPFDEKFSEGDSKVEGKLVLLYYLKTGNVQQVTRIYID